MSNDKPWEDFSITPEESSEPWNDYEPIDEPAKDRGFTGALIDGAKSTGRAISSTYNTYTGDGQAVVDNAKAQELANEDKSQDIKNFQSDFAANTGAGTDEEVGLWGAIKGTGKAIVDNPRGAALSVVEQFPNSVPTLAAGWAGAKGGAMAGGAVGSAFGGVGAGPGALIGGAAGFVGGMFLGNTLTETGHKAQEYAADGEFTPDEQSAAMTEGAKKSGVMTAVDALTFAIGGKVSSTMRRTAENAVEAATRKTLLDAGVDISDTAALTAARSNPQIASQVVDAQKNAAKIADNLRKRAGEAGALLTMETVGEGLGEYLGELAATGQASVSEAVLESFLSLGQSSVQSMFNFAKAREKSLTEQEWIDASNGIAPEGMAPEQMPVADGIWDKPTPEAKIDMGQMQGGGVTPAPVFDQQDIDSKLGATPSQQMGINPDAGPLSAAAAQSVDSGLFTGGFTPQAGINQSALEREGVTPPPVLDADQIDRNLGSIDPITGEYMPAPEQLGQSSQAGGAGNYEYDQWGNLSSVDGRTVEGYGQNQPRLGFNSRAERSTAPLYEVGPDGVARPTSGETARSRKERIDLSTLEGRQQTQAQKQPAAMPEQRTPEQSAQHSWDSMNTFERNAAAANILGARGVLAKNTATKAWNKLSAEQQAKLVSGLDAQKGQRWTDPNQKVTDQTGPVLQNRDRTSQDSINQMRGISNNPDYSRLKTSGFLSDGAPVAIDENIKVPASQVGVTDTASAGGKKFNVQYAVVEADQFVTSNSIDGRPNTEYAAGSAGKARAIAGNGRITGLQSAWAKGKADQYKADMAADKMHGIDAAVIEEMKNPILVRLLPQDEVTDNIGDLSNRDEKGKLSPVEQAKTDMGRIDLDSLKFTAEGAIGGEAIHQFRMAQPAAERVSEAEARKRLTSAIFQKAYGNDQLTEIQAGGSDDAKSIISALAQAAPSMSRLEGAAEFDIRPTIAQAGIAAVNAARRGIKLADYVQQAEMGIDPRAYPVLEMMLNDSGNIRSGKYIGEQLTDMAKLAYDEAKSEGSDMFGEKPKRTSDQVIQDASTGVQGYGQINDGSRQEGLGQQAGSELDAQMAEGPESGRERPADTEQIAPIEQQAEVTAKPISLDFTDTSVRVYGDVDTIRQRLRAEGINFSGAEIEGGLSYGKKLESKIKAVFSEDLDQEAMTDMADDTPIEMVPAEAVEQAVEPQPEAWRANYLRAAKAARDLGIDPKQHKKLIDLIAAIDAANNDVDTVQLEQSQPQQQPPSLDLTQQTEESRAAAEAEDKARIDAEKKTKDKQDREDKKAREKAADTQAVESSLDRFGLGQSVDEQLSGQVDMLAGNQETKSVNKNEPVKLEQTVEDFGEKMAGAIKDQSVNSLNKNLTDEEMASQPLSSLWPVSEVLAHDNDFVAAFSYVARDNIPAKPRLKYKVKRWVDTVKAMRELAKTVQDGEITQSSIESVSKTNGTAKSLSAKARLLSGVDRKHWSRIGRVDVSDNAYIFDDNRNKVPSPHTVIVVDGRSVLVKGKYDNDSVTAVIKASLEMAEQSDVSKRGQFEIRETRTTGEIFINRKGDKEYRKLKTFPKGAIKEAREFVNNNTNELVAAWEDIKERDNVTKADVRSDTNKERTGIDYRNGKDVTSEEFGEAFGFRGVEFGNWVSQGRGQKDRQGMLNAAYDALFDLAAVVGIPPKAISLNGSLGIGFGSRGKGKASAHYETNNIVINLTKTKGAGSLAHEWFHALDNYFSRRRGVTPFDGNQAAYNKANYITYKPEPMMALKTSLNKKGLRPHLITKAEYDRRAKNGVNFDADSWTPDTSHPIGVRPVVEKAFAELVNELDKSPMLKRAETIDKGKVDGYWSSIIERAARSFENYVIQRLEDQGITNEYLANVVPVEQFMRDPGRYPYLTSEELKPVAEKFDTLFSTIETREEKDGNFLMFSRHNNQPSSPTTNASLLKNINDNYPALTKSVTTMLQRGRTGQKGGLVVVDSNNGADIAKAYSKATGLPIAQANRLFSDGESINGFYDTKSGITFLVGPNLDATTAPAVLLHELTHSQQRSEIDARSMKLINGRAKEKNADLKTFLDTVSQRMIDAGEYGNPLESTSYIVEQAVIEGRSQGYTLADSKLLNAIEKTLGSTIANIIRDFTKMVRQFALRRGLPINITLDDIVQYAMASVEQAAKGNIATENKDSMAYSFAGEDALTADLKSLAEAKKQIATDLTPEQVRKNTGWMQGAEGRWRFEIDDSKASFVDALMLDSYLAGTLTGEKKLNAADQKALNLLKLKERKMSAEVFGAKDKETEAWDQLFYDWHQVKQQIQTLERRASGEFMNVGSLLKHDQLLNAYPGMKNIKIRLAIDDSVTMNGFYDRKDNLIEMTAPNKEKLLDGLLHELQHAIQSTEGFARGGSPTQFDYKDATSEYLSRVSNKIIDLLNSNKEFGATVRKVKQEFIKLSNKYPQTTKDGQETVNWDKVPADESEAYFKLLDETEKHPEVEHWHDLETEYRVARRDGKTLTPFEQYQSLAGEVEARNVESRRHFTEEERKEFSPIVSEDFQRQDQTIRFSKAQTKTPAFKKWFGDSKVADGNGEPLVVYHGTTADFSEFSLEFLGDGDGNTDWGDGFYFSSDPNAANNYAEGDGGNVMPAYLAINNPATSDVMLSDEVQGVLDDGMGFEDLAEVLGGMGYDGIAIKHKSGATEYVVFNDTQIKSATGNNGDFDGTNPDIRYSKKQAYNPNQGDLLAELEKISNDDPYAKTKQRPGTTEKQRELGRSALTDFFRWLKNSSRAGGNKAGAGSGEVSLLGASIYKDFQAGKPYQLIGQTIESPKDLAALAQVYRDPRFETFRAFFVDKDGKIILEQTASTRMPASVSFSDDLYMELNRSLENSGADKFYIMHNHPSGVPTPSPPDIAMTEYMGKVFGKKMAGHVVIDHNSYAVIDENGNVTEHQDERLAGIDFSSNPEVDHASLNKQINSPDQMALVAKQVANSDTPILVVTKAGAVNRVGLIASVPMELLNKGNSDKRDTKFTAAVRRMIRAAGAGGALFVVLPKSYGTKGEGYHFEHGSLQWMHKFAQDVVDSDGNSVIFARHQVSIDDYASISIKDGRTSKQAARMREESGVFDRSNPDISFSKSQVKTETFKKAFGKSKVVDSNGEPLLVYHGSGAKFATFDKSKRGATTRAKSAEEGFFFTSSKSLAYDFKKQAEGAAADLDAIRGAVEGLSDSQLESLASDIGRIASEDLDLEGRDFFIDSLMGMYEYDTDINTWPEESNGTPKALKKYISKDILEPGAIHDVYLRIENPHEHTFSEDDDSHDEGAITKAIIAAQKNGNDGVILRNMVDVARADEKGNNAIRSDVYIAFEPDQIIQSEDSAGIRFSRSANPASVNAAPNGMAAWDSPSASKFDDFVYKIQDKHVDTKRVIAAIRDTGKAISDDLDVYLQETLFHGRAAKRTQDFLNMEVNPLIEYMQSAKVDMSDLEEFLHARHAQEANALIAKRDPNMPDGGSGMTNAEAAKYLKSLNGVRRKQFENAAKMVDKIIGGTRETIVNYGLESKETVDGWANGFKHYIPLQREDKDGQMGIGQGFSVKGKETKGRTGSTRKVVDILANVMMQRERIIVRGEKNRVAAALLGLAKDNPLPDFWKVDVVPTNRVIDKATGLVRNQVDPTYKNRDNAVVAKVNGKEHAILMSEDDPRAMRMAEALKNLDAAQLEGLLGATATATRYFAAVNTQYNPIFGVTNFVRDIQEAMLHLQSTPLEGQQARLFKNTFTAVKAVMKAERDGRKGQAATGKWGKLWDDFQNTGGQTGYRDQFNTSSDRGKAIQKALTPDGWAATGLGKFFTVNGTLKAPLEIVRKKAGWLFDLLSDYNTAMENGVRLSAYETGINSGMSKEQAAALAKSLTVNFNRKGQVTQQVGSLYAFFNASVQGSARLGESLFDMEPGKPKTMRLSKLGKRIVSGGVLLGASQAVLQAMMGFDDDEPPEFIRERNIIIPTGGKTYISIPMPLGYHVIANLGRIPTEFALGGGEDAAKHLMSLMDVMADVYNPLGSSGLSMQTIAPTVLDPLAALAENKDFSGRAIAKESFNRQTPGHALARDTASLPATWLAQVINYATGGTEFTRGEFSPTPDQIDYLVGQLTGGVGREATKFLKSGQATASGDDLPWHNIPLVGRFYGDANSDGAKQSAFYNNMDSVRKHAEEVKGLRAAGRSGEAVEYANKHPHAKLHLAARAAEKQVKGMRDRKRELEQAGAPREEIRALETRMIQRMEQFVELSAVRK